MNDQQSDRQSRDYRRRWWTLVVLSLSILIVVIDNTILNVALPTLQRELGATGADLQWMVDAYILSFAALLLLMGSLGVATFVLGLLALHVPPRRLWRRTAWIFLVLTGVAAFSAGYDWYRFDSVRRGVVVVDEVTVRKGNAESYEPAFTEPMTEGMEFRLVERRGSWLQIELSNGNRGWVPEDTVVTY